MIPLDEAEIIERISTLFRVSPKDVTGRRKFPPLADARHVAMWVFRRPPFRYSYPRIADIFGRDHTTVLYGVRKADKILRNHDLRAALLRAIDNESYMRPAPEPEEGVAA